MPKLEKILKLFQCRSEQANSTNKGGQCVDLQRAIGGDAVAELGEIHVIADLRGVGGGAEKKSPCFAGRYWARGGNRDAEKRSRHASLCALGLLLYVAASLPLLGIRAQSTPRIPS